MSAHTEGPWKVGTVGDIWAVTPVTKTGKPRNGRNTEDICQGSKYADNWKEDAALIAAAPAMLAALDDILNCVDGPFDNEWLARCRDKVRAAIAQARG